MPENKPSYYAIIPANVRYDQKLPPNAKLLYGEISALTNKEGYCYASNAYFCEQYEFSDRTITRLIEALESEGYITTEISRDERNKVTGRKIRLRVSATGEQPPDKIVRASRQNCQDPPDKIVRDNNTKNNKAEINMLSSEFDRFWAAYPRKTDKKKARVAFAKVNVSVDVLLAALERQKKTEAWTKAGGQYIPHPTTWLNGERWEDEVKVAPPPGGGRAAPVPQRSPDVGEVWG